MSETEIPQDVWNTARKEADFYAQWLHAGNSTGSLSPHAVDGLTDSIARAILAERERCAKIADEWVFDAHALAQATDYGRGVHDTSKATAIAIRKGAHP